jgi:hypothetical protein
VGALGEKFKCLNKPPLPMSNIDFRIFENLIQWKI